MKKQIPVFCLLVAILFLAVTCSDSLTGPDSPKGELPRQLTESEQLLVEADHEFSYNLFRETVAWDNDEENIFISPLSVSMALTMTLNGAGGQTFEDIRETLVLSGMELEQINESFQSLTELLINADPAVQIKIANSIWHRDGLAVNEEFRQRMQEFFEARIEGLDFSDPASVNIINNWVEENTEGLIDEIIKEIPSNVVMYLINALYFKGDWLRQFDPEDTGPADFHLESGETVEVEMMRQEEQFAIYLSDEVQMVELPYGDSLFTMTVLMPANPDTPIDQFVQEELTSENLAEWRSNLNAGHPKIPVSLPKFELEYEITYNDILKAMGMEVAFDGRADFSGLVESETAGLYIDEVKHKTFIRVDEEGTEAAAVTSVAIAESLPPSITVNRPFIFLIYERESGVNLFMGKVKKPVL